jgi:hypothetical protein
VQQIHSRPSELLCVEDPLVAYLFDAAVVTFGNIIEGAMHERIEVGFGDRKEWKQKYTLHQLLDSKFKLPEDKEEIQKGRSNDPFAGGGLAAVLAIAGQQGSGVKKWEYKPN